MQTAQSLLSFSTSTCECKHNPTGILAVGHVTQEAPWYEQGLHNLIGYDYERRFVEVVELLRINALHNTRTFKSLG